MLSNSGLAERLAAVGVAALHEVLGRRGLLSGLSLLADRPFAGPVLTVELPAAENLGLHLALEEAAAGSVMCVGSAGGGRYGVLGEILHGAGRVRGIVGFAIDDAIRDVAQLEPPPSVAARGVNARGTVKRRLRRPVGSAVAIGGQLVMSGDWLVCDRDGACVFPEARLEDALRRAEARLAREQEALSQVAHGATTRAVLELTSDPQASVS